MHRHLKNINEACLYAGISCGIAFLVRLNPSLFFPVLFVRLGLLFYCWFIIFEIENNKAFGLIVGAASVIGWVGGYWDYIELTFKYQLNDVIAIISTITVITIITFLLWIKSNESNKKAS